MSNTDPQPVEPCLTSTLNYEILTHIISYLPVQDALSFARADKFSKQVAYDELTYEPFGEWSETAQRPVQLGAYQVRLPPSDIDFKILRALACNVWNSLVRTINEVWKDRRLTDGERKELRELDDIAKGVTPGYSDNVVSVTRRPDGKRLLFATNEAAKGRQLENIQKVASSEIVGNYLGAPFQHTETRLAEYQHRQQYSAPIGVDRSCCLFCAAQLVALGRVRNWTTVEAKGLKGYVFSKYVLYFRKYRSQMWGDGMEQVFAALPPDARLRLLHLIVTESVRQPLSKAEKNCDHTLEQIREALGLPVEGRQDENTNDAPSRGGVGMTDFDEFFDDLPVDEWAAIDAALSSAVPTQTDNASTSQASTTGPDADGGGFTPEQWASIEAGIEEMERAKRKRGDEGDRGHDSKRQK